MNKLTIINQNGKLLTDSRDVAEITGKEHSHLMRDIKGYENIINSSFENPNLDSLDFFIPSKYSVEGNNKSYPCYLLTKKGCDMVANKMTGEKGVLFTATYVTKFEEMEQTLQSQFKLPSNFKEALLQLVQAEEEKETLQIELTEKSKFINQIAVSQNSLLVREVAKIASKSNIVIGEKRLWAKLREWGMIFKKSTEPMQEGINRGYFEVTEGAKESKSGTFTFHTTRVTGIGQEYIINRLIKEVN